MVSVSRRKENEKSLPGVLFNLVPLSKSLSCLQGGRLFSLSPGACLIGLSAVAWSSQRDPPQSGTEELALCKAVSPCGGNPSAELEV